MTYLYKFIQVVGAFVNSTFFRTFHIPLLAVALLILIMQIIYFLIKGKKVDV